MHKGGSSSPYTDKENDGVQYSYDQLQALQAVKEGKNVFITGSAGVGKSFILEEIIKVLPRSSTYVTASTGVAACNIGGITLYSFAGIGLGTDSVQSLINKISCRRAPRQRWLTCTTLIVDEISMISGELFDKVETIARKIRGNEKPFGGIQLVLCGDFFQLPPVTKNGKNIQFCFETERWQTCIQKTIALRQVFRQKDEFFVKILNRIRYGKFLDEDIDTLNKCKNTVFDITDGIKPTLLFPHRISCSDVNASELSKLQGSMQTYESIDGGKEEYINQLSKHSKYAKVLNLRVGAQVMLLSNINVSSGLVNGARGVVVSFVSSEEMPDCNDYLLDHSVVHYPLVRFANGLEMMVTREKSTIEIAGLEVAYRYQLPLALAWAVSIHKSQGITLGRCEMSLKDVFAPGQAYVALSRVTGLEGLKLRDLDVSKIFSHPSVIEYYEKLGFEDCDVTFCPAAEKVTMMASPDTGNDAIAHASVAEANVIAQRLEILKTFKTKGDALYKDHCYCKADPKDTNFGQPFQITVLNHSEPTTKGDIEIGERGNPISITDDEMDSEATNSPKPSRKRRSRKRRRLNVTFCGGHYFGSSLGVGSSAYRNSRGNTCSPMTSNDSIRVMQVRSGNCNSSVVPGPDSLVCNGKETSQQASQKFQCCNIPPYSSSGICKENNGVGSLLNSEQRARIEENRLKALRRREEIIKKNASFLTSFS